MAVLLIIIGIILLPGVILVGIFNRFVKNKNTVKDGWSNIDVALKRRYDLIPNLVETVKGYASHEKETLLQKTLRSIFALSEAYPDLKANTSFLQLQDKLNEIEENLERARRYYNGTVRENNTYGESFPAVLVAGMFNYQHFDFFEVEPESRENVKVSFT